jgi:hypothetical protein
MCGSPFKQAINGIGRGLIKTGDPNPNISVIADSQNVVIPAPPGTVEMQ